MKALVILLSVSLMVFLGQEAVTLHKLTVCRQEAWRSSVTLMTRTLLSEAPATDKDILFRCGIVSNLKNNKVSWFRITSHRLHYVTLKISGKL